MHSDPYAGAKAQQGEHQPQSGIVVVGGIGNIAYIIGVSNAAGTAAVGIEIVLSQILLIAARTFVPVVILIGGPLVGMLMLVGSGNGLTLFQLLAAILADFIAGVTFFELTGILLAYHNGVVLVQVGLIAAVTFVPVVLTIGLPILGVIVFMGLADRDMIGKERLKWLAVLLTVQSQATVL